MEQKVVRSLVPSQTGVESGLIDVWAFRWMKTDGSKATPVTADVLSVYFRVPESSFACLHSASGTDGVFFERKTELFDPTAGNLRKIAPK